MICQQLFEGDAIHQALVLVAEEHDVHGREWVQHFAGRAAFVGATLPIPTPLRALLPPGTVAQQWR